MQLTPKSILPDCVTSYLQFKFGGIGGVLISFIRFESTQK